jgi:hypothetical protein
MGSSVTVWKYSIPLENTPPCGHVVEMVDGAEILHAGFQMVDMLPNGPGYIHEVYEVQIWAKIDLCKKGPLRERRFATLATGEEFASPRAVIKKDAEMHQFYRSLECDVEMEHIGTLKIQNNYIIHVFEIAAYIKNPPVSILVSDAYLNWYPTEPNA